MSETGTTLSEQCNNASSSEIMIQHELCDCEPLNFYAEGGYHPIVIGDIIGGRYEVVHKLGYGGTATVWLARDQKGDRNVALKAFTSRASPDSGQRELSAYNHLQANLPVEHRNLILPLYDSFHSDSPNGNHLCLVLGLSGPSLSNIIRSDKSMKLRPDVTQQISLQVAQGLFQMHKVGIIYHDLSPNNLLLQLDDTVATLSVAELYKRCGRPESYRWSTRSDTSASDAHAPTYLYDSLDFTKLENMSLVKPAIKFVDLAEIGYLEQQEPDTSHGMTLVYTDPETMWWRSVQTQASDVWSLACVLFELRASELLIAPGEGNLWEIKNGIIGCIGRLPDEWRHRIDEEAKAKGEAPPVRLADLSLPTAFDDDDDFEFSDMNQQIRELKEANRPRGIFQKTKIAAFRLKKAILSLFPERPTPTYYWVEEGFPKMPQSLKDIIGSIGTWTPWCNMTVKERMETLTLMHKRLNTRNVKITRKECDTGEPPHKPLSDEEAKDFLELLSMMLTWERKDRASLEDVLKHRWFTTDYAGNKDEPWVQKFHRGYQYWSNGRPIW